MKYTFTFKEIKTQLNICLLVNSTNTISEFIENVKKVICENFPMLRLYNFDIVEAGHYNNSNSSAPELADKLDVMYNGNDTLEQIYGTRWKNISFYIRIASDNLVTLIHQNSMNQ